MVTGIESFKEWFSGSEEQYTIIGGTACDILMTEEIDPTVRITMPAGVYKDIQEFVQRMESESVDLKQLGLPGRTKDQILEELKEMYIV